MSALLGAAIPAAAGLAGGLFNGFSAASTSRRNTDRQIQAQKELAEYSYAKDLEMWNRANAYNDPSAQMKRLEGAGLNPNLVYGHGSVAGNTSTQTLDIRRIILNTIIFLFSFLIYFLFCHSSRILRSRKLRLITSRKKLIGVELKISIYLTLWVIEI